MTDGTPSGAAWWRRLFGTADERSLPARVRAAIREQQDASEILIGWIQLAVVITFGVLYAVSPKTFRADAPFEPVPWALGFYFSFTLIRLYAAYRHRLPFWFLAVSVVLDIVLLLGLIWSFHIQYAQPPSFVLKAPTLLYVFIFIALRALRFEARFVLLTGLVAAAGWLLLVLYVVTVDPADNMITRDYVTYLTSNTILLGAEFDKVASILVVTAIIALALHRGRQLLVRAISEETAARDLSRFFAPEIARQITHAEARISAGEGEIREAAILTLDIRGFTRLAARMAAGDVISLLAEYQARMVPLIHRHGGTVDKFIGDGILASFGAAVPSETHARDALLAVDAIMAAAAAWREERRSAGLEAVEIGAAVATGPVVFGAVGDESRLEYTVIGDPVNLSAKLEKHTKAESVRALTTAESYALARAQGYRPPREPAALPGRAVAGVEDPVDLVVLAD